MGRPVHERRLLLAAVAADAGHASETPPLSRVFPAAAFRHKDSALSPRPSRAAGSRSVSEPPWLLDSREPDEYTGATDPVRSKPETAPFTLCFHCLPLSCGRQCFLLWHVCRLIPLAATALCTSFRCAFAAVSAPQAVSKTVHFAKPQHGCPPVRGVVSCDCSPPNTHCAPKRWPSSPRIAVMWHVCPSVRGSTRRAHS